MVNANDEQKGAAKNIIIIAGAVIGGFYIARCCGLEGDFDFILRKMKKFICKKHYFFSICSIKCSPRIDG